LIGIKFSFFIWQCCGHFVVFVGWHDLHWSWRWYQIVCSCLPVPININHILLLWINSKVHDQIKSQCETVWRSYLSSAALQLTLFSQQCGGNLLIARCVVLAKSFVAENPHPYSSFETARTWQLR
jgi:hypothetical protein